jgi:DDE family transposase
VVRADEASLTPYAGLVISGELCRSLRLGGLIDEQLAGERRARPVKQRRRGLSPGELFLSLVESQLAGGEYFDHIEDLRADLAGAPLRAVAAPPAAPTMLQNAKRFRRVHVQAIERAFAAAGERLDRALGRDAGEPVTIDLDATQVAVYGRGKDGAGRSRHGTTSFAPHVAFWAERGRALTSELVGGNREKLTAPECGRIVDRALSLLPAGHGEVSCRIDSAYYKLELLQKLRARRARFSVSVPRTTAMWNALAAIPEQAWQQAEAMDGAEVAETSYTPTEWQGEPLRLLVRRVAHSAADVSAGSVTARRRKTIPPQQLALALEGATASVFGYSFILTDIPDRDPVWLEHFHRQRAQIEERLKEAKLGQPLRHLPSGDENANRVWLTASLAALTLSAFCCDLSPAAGASGKAPADAPLRRTAKTLRRQLFCIPARIVRTSRYLILRLPEGFRHLDTFKDTLDAVYALPP